MAFIYLEAGERAAPVLVDGKKYWVGRSRNGRFLKRLFATLAAALAAGDEADEVEELALDLRADPFMPYLVLTPDDESLVLLGNEENDCLWGELLRYGATAAHSIGDLQVLVNAIMAQHPGAGYSI
ncbi:hypothetical protein AB7828_05670 [Tardiphaga sp. 215_C5_N2_1]|uniref:hypothetical protein n=1 Tax=unclassified Tardiphaga TaxID=2631404 RepID=UPI003F210B56